MPQTSSTIITSLAIQHLRTLFQAHHQLYTLPVKGEYVENLLYNALTLAHPTQTVEWQPGSHRTDYDLALLDPHTQIKTPLSVKSGQLSATYLVLSGHRLQRSLQQGTTVQQTWTDSADTLVQSILSKAVTTVSLSTPKPKQTTTINQTYTLFVIPASFFHPPPKASWTVTPNAITSQNALGVKFRLCPSLSWQLWWEIPLSLLPPIATFVAP